ncbi:hypothetical protein H6A06_08980, partial [Collinsella intestinalis]|nr:hypothetical protein [Collinsella intestinalis]
MAKTIGLIWDRVNTVVATQGFRRAQAPFGFDSQPDTTLDTAYYLTSERIETDGYIG